jgi:hypothetical protein
LIYCTFTTSVIIQNIVSGDKLSLFEELLQIRPRNCTRMHQTVKDSNWNCVTTSVTMMPKTGVMFLKTIYLV